MLEDNLDHELEVMIHNLRQRVVVLNQIEALVKQYASNSPLPDNIPVAKRRGRKGMTPEQRQEVSERMTRYWASRRKTKKS